MKRSDIADIIGVIRARYPQSVWGPNEEMTVEAWYMSLGDLPLEPVKQALAAMFNESRFAPDPSEIRARLLDASGLAPDPADAWQLVCAERRAYYPGFQNTVSLPAPVMAAVKAIGGMHQLATSDRPDKDREAFLQAYATYRKRAMAEVGLGLPMLSNGHMTELGR